MNKFIFFLLFFSLTFGCSLKNKANNQVISKAKTNQHDSFKLAFWNIENLFDTLNDPNIMDEEFTPTGTSKWNSAVYNAKLKNLSKVINDLNVDILGMGEVENLNVLKDLAKFCNIKYSIVHFDSPDERGIDVALFYNTLEFNVVNKENLKVSLNDTNTTRDILKVKLQHIKSKVFFNVYVNHWPSRRGGQETSNPWRCKAAEILKKSMKEVGNEVCIAMGDLNDGPKDYSIIQCLQAGYPGDTKDSNSIFYDLARFIKTDKEGSHKYAGKWNMLDHIIISKNMWPNVANEIYFQPYSFAVFNPSYLIQQDGKYAGSPARGMSGSNWINGYSDHLPVIAVFKVKTQ